MRALFFQPEGFDMEPFPGSKVGMGVQQGRVDFGSLGEGMRGSNVTLGAKIHPSSG